MKFLMYFGLLFASVMLLFRYIGKTYKRNKTNSLNQFQLKEPNNVKISKPKKLTKVNNKFYSQYDQDWYDKINNL